jgi:chromosome segregation ATPase
VNEPESERTPAAGPVENGAAVLGSAEIGARVSAVLNAAEEAAAQIQAEAREEAARLVREAEERGRARVEELTGEPERLVAEAQADAARAREAAAADALRTRTDAADAARKIEEDGQRRKAELHDELRQIEEERQRVLNRMQRTLNGLRGATTQLEGAVETYSRTSAEEEAARPRRRFFGLGRGSVSGFTAATGGTRGDESVYDTLQQTVERAGDRRVAADGAVNGNAPADEETEGPAGRGRRKT